MNKMVPKVLHVAVGHILCIFHVCLLFQCGPILIIDFKSSHKHVLKPCLKVKFVDGLYNDRPSPCKFQLFCSEILSHVEWLAESISSFPQSGKSVKVSGLCHGLATPLFCSTAFTVSSI